MSTINASVINQSREQAFPRDEAPSTDTRNQENKSTLDQQDPLNQTKPKMKATSIGNYILGKTLGEGTFGKVKLATHILTGEKVAIKILEKDRIIDVADVERVAREIYILKFIRHPNIIQLYEIIETPKQLFLVTEFISGGELFDYIVSKTRVDEKEASKFFHQIIAGIEYIHKLKIVHRDLKPENLLLDYNKNIKIVDFGLSNTYNENELLKTACGSPCYAAPEMIGGKKYNGLQVDIWSCGVILFAIVCGYLPFEDANTAVLYKKILSGDYTIPSFISEEGKDLIQNILNIDPVRRYTIEDIRKHPWMNQIDVPKKPEGIVVGYHQTPVDHEILKQLEQYGFQYDNAQKCLDANKHNHVTTTYYLLLKRFHQKGGRSTADINSEAFDKSLLLPKVAQPKANNYASVGYENDGEKENERRVERNRSRNRSIDQNQSFAYGEMNIKQRQSKEIAKIYGSIIDSSSRDRVPTPNQASMRSRILKENNFIDNGNNTNEFKRRSFTGKRIISPARNESKENKSSKAADNKEPFTPSHNQTSHPQNWFLNKTFNQNLKKKLKEISRVGLDKPPKQRHMRGESFDGSFNGMNQSYNHDIFNDSSKLDMKDTNTSLAYPTQPRLFDYSTKNANTKKQAFASIQPSPKKDQRGSHYLDERVVSNIHDLNKVTRNLKGISSIGNYHDKVKTTSQSPSRVNQALPKEPGYTKPRDSSANPYRKALHTRKNSCKPGIQLNNGKAWRPSSNQALVRERGKSIGGGADDSFKVASTHDTSMNMGNSSFMLNSSFQKKINDQSFDYQSQQPRGYLNTSNKRISYGGENTNKRGRNVNYSPVNTTKKNL